MRPRRIVVATAAAFLVLSATAWAGGASLSMRGAYFFPKDEVFRDVYKSFPVFGAELHVPLSGPLGLVAGAEVFSRTGLLPLSEERTKLLIVPLSVGLRLQAVRGAVRPYLGAAGAWFFFHEENPIGEASESGPGFIAQTGLLIKIGGPVWLDLRADYRLATLTSDGDDPVKADIGGLAAGAGIAIRF